MNLTIFILKRYRIRGKIAQLTSDFLPKHQTSENSLKTSEVVTLMHIIHVCTLGRSQLCGVLNYTSIDTVGSSDVKLASMLAEHGDTQLLLHMVVQNTQE